MTHWRCCCGGVVAAPCCGCGSCPATLTLTAVETYHASWLGGGSCDLSYSATNTTVMTLVRVDNADGLCAVPPAAEEDCDQCQWAVGGGSTYTEERPWDDPCAGADPPPSVVPVGPFTPDTPDTTVGLKCGTCYNPPESAETYILRAGSSAGGVFFEATGGANDSTTCPQDMTWTVTSPTGPPDLSPLWVAEDWSLEWTLT